MCTRKGNKELLLKLFICCFFLMMYWGMLGCGDDGPDTITGNSNNPPTIQEQSDTTVSIGDTLRLQAIAHDPDGDSISFRIIIYVDLIHGNLPDIDFNNQTGLFWFAPTSLDKPGLEFEFVARDVHNAESSTKFMVHVEE
jgi:hypothetical protein